MFFKKSFLPSPYFHPHYFAYFCPIQNTPTGIWKNIYPWHPLVLTLSTTAVKVGHMVEEHVCRDRDFLLSTLQIPVRKGDFTLRERIFICFKCWLAKFGKFFPHRHPIPYPQDNNMIPRSISSTEPWRVNPAQTIELLRPSLITRKNSEKLFFQNLVNHKLC